MKLNLALPSLDAATDPTVLQPPVQERLERAWAEPVEVTSLHVARAMPRPGGALTLQIRAAVRRAGDAAPRQLLLGAHLLGHGETWPDWVRDGGDAVLVLEPLRLAVALFPFDPKLDVLPHLVDPERARLVLEDLLGRTAGPGTLRCDVLAYRLERRCVLRWSQDGERGDRPLIVKAVRPARVGPLRDAVRRLEGSEASGWVPRTLALDARRGVQLQELAPGVSLHDLAGDPALVSGSEAAGLRLRDLHGLDPEGLPPFGRDDALRQLGEVVETVAAWLPDLATALRSARRDVEARRPVGGGPRRCVHRDFYDKQVLHAPERTTLLDWDNLAAGDPAQDHGNFLAHLELRAEQEPRHAALAVSASEAFRRGYGAAAVDFEARSRWWRAAALVRIGALYALRRRWRPLMPALLGRAHRALVSTAVLAASALVAAAGPAGAAAPEYMRIRPHVGQSLEMEGARNGDGIFVAANVESLPDPRRPSLRGAIESVDLEKRTMRILGVDLQVPPDTQSEDPDSLRVPFEKLRPGHRVEVSCKVQEDGAWVARRLRAHGIKSSDKVKGAVTRAAVDGSPPDTLEISGFRVLLDTKTRVKFRLGQAGAMEEILFGDLAAPSAAGARHGVALARGRLLLGAESRGQLVAENDLALSQRFPSDESETQPEIRVAATAYGGAGLRAHVQARLRRNFVLASDLDRGSEEVQAHLTELYALWMSPGKRRVALQIGRQDFDEPREWIFDEYLDAARLHAYGLGPLVVDAAVIHGVQPFKPQFETWTDVFAMARWYRDRKSHAGAWVLRRRDSDARQREPIWTGLRWWGRMGPRIRSWTDVALLRGEDKGKRLHAWAADVGGTYQDPAFRWLPSVTAGFAVGSGDASTSDGVDGNFRQTGYEDNYARFGGVAALKYYGTLVDPELSNLEVVTLGAGVRPVNDASLDLVWHGYRQRTGDDRFRNAGLVDPPARPNGASPDLGWALDVIVAGPLLWNAFRARWTSAFFRPGRAFDPRREDAWLHKLEFAAAF